MNRLFTLPLYVSFVMLAACASVPQSQYYTLTTGSQASVAEAEPDFAISLGSVNIPQQVDRPQIVLSNENQAQVTLLNDSLWVAPLANEIRDALAQNLSQRLGVLELTSREVPESLPFWALSVTVQRFESIYGNKAVLEATWRQTPRQGANGAATACRALITVPVDEGMPALVAGHQQALVTLGELMADALTARPLSPNKNTALKGCV